MALHVNKVSGKCCLEDTIEMWTGYKKDKIDAFLARTEFYEGLDEGLNPKNKISILSYKDLVPYLPRCESFGSFSKNGKNIIVLSSRPHWAWEETERIEWKVKDVLRIYNRCKRKHIPFNEEDCFNEVNHFYYDNEEMLKEIIHRIAILGKKATFTDIHLNLTNILYRKPFIEEMVAEGYSVEDATAWAYDEIKKW